MLPMIGLYVVGIWLASIVGRPLVWQRGSWLEAAPPNQSDDSLAPPA
jgi:hypothetical protein